jgi:hypothetical protein
MLNEGQRYLFIDRTNSTGQISTLPYLPISLSNGNNSIEVMALLDTGAIVSVIPYETFIQLGAVWENQTHHPAIPNSEILTGCEIGLPSSKFERGLGMRAIPCKVIEEFLGCVGR